MKIMLYTLLAALVAYLLVVGCIYAFQRHLMYHTDRNIGPPAQYHLSGFSEGFVTTSDNETIQFWYHPADAGFPTIVYYHGNAYTLGDRADIFSAMSSKGFGLLAISYRGYGKSTGEPTEQGIYIDARTALHYALESLHIPVSHVILFGESLGTGVAVQMATEYDVGGIVLQSPYTSVEERAAEIYNFVPVKYLIKDKYDTIDKIAYVKAPLLLFHGDRDVVIPVAHGHAVLAAATSPKDAFFFPENGHNDFDSAVISEHVLHFADKYHLIAH